MIVYLPWDSVSRGNNEWLISAVEIRTRIARSEAACRDLSKDHHVLVASYPPRRFRIKRTP